MKRPPAAHIGRLTAGMVGIFTFFFVVMATRPWPVRAPTLTPLAPTVARLASPSPTPGVSTAPVSPSNSPSSPTASPVAPEPSPTPTRPPRPFLMVSATWYCKPGVSRCTAGYPGGLYAAISPDLAHLRGKVVTIAYNGRSVRVRLIDCNCQARQAIDLYAEAFERLAPLSKGRINVRLRYR